MSAGERGFEVLSKNPGLGELLMRMLRAQDLAVESGAEAVTAIAQQINQGEEDD